MKKQFDYATSSLSIMLNFLVAFSHLHSTAGLPDVPKPSAQKIAAIEKESAENKDGETSLMVALNKKNMNLITYFLKRYPEQINQPTSPVGGFNFPLFRATWYGDFPAVKLLVDNKAHVNQATQNGETALMRASMDNHHNIMRYLIAHGADVNQKDRKGNTALDYAILFDDSKPDVQTVNILKDAGADINEYYNNIKTRLLYAIDNNFDKIVNVLIQAGANLDLPRKDTELTPFELSFSLPKPNVEIARMLIEAGANIDLTYTKKKPLIYLIQLIIQDHKNFRKYNEQAELDILKMMLNSKKVSKETLNKALLLATKQNHVQLIDLLIRAGAELPKEASKI